MLHTFKCCVEKQNLYVDIKNSRRFLPLSAHSLACTAFSSADAHMPSLSLPMLCSDVGFRSILLSGRGWEDMGMPYRKLESIELLADAS